MTNFRIIEGGTPLLETITPLWRKLTRHHAGISVHFSNEFQTMRWPDRRADLLEKAAAGSLRIALAETAVKRQCVGYCVAVVNNRGHAEIESMYIEEAYRRRGVGSALVKRMLIWFGRKKVKSASVNVAVGNESAFKFYEQWGFYPRVTALVRKK
ncbi:MAG TPA: GNAT family N-acetyltransferase [Chitinivibrionales bacterium]|jgi:ribosomal protein S18 acetylase RimI-like enzyme|nr:GNAT family N-acetyltransferase [Chitinivibrionales bacterium]